MLRMARRVFDSRTGNKTYLVLMPILLVLLLALKFFAIIFGVLFAGCVVSRLNDIGWSRWHAAWLTVWAILVKFMIVGALAAATHSGNAHVGGIGLVELPLFVLLVGLAFVPGTKVTNRFGPKPIGLREFWNARASGKKFRKAFLANKPENDRLLAEMNAVNARIKHLSAEYTANVDRLGLEGARSERKDLDQAHADFAVLQAKVREVQARWLPAQEAFKPSLNRTMEILDYRSKPERTA
jgi:uncharacterized membrane protein YhaH (DUF805 family)